MPYAIGLNSGSSFDGVDAVLVELDLDGDGQITPPRFVHGLSTDWPAEVQEKVLAAFDNSLSIFELTRLNYVVGAVFAEAARTLMDDRDLRSDDVAVIGYDGQTIYQEPPEHRLMSGAPTAARPFERWTEWGYPCGLQIGEPGVVAVLTDVPTVTQFRPVDHALGGTGAPLMQFLDYVAFRHLAPIATLNIGGIANIQVAEADRSRMKAFDCGPGNVMLDHAMRRLFGFPYDVDGATAARGEVVDGFLSELKSHPFFAREIPRCAWRLDFGAEYADTMLDKYAYLSSEDVMATLTQFSAWAIVRSFKDNVPEADRFRALIASGGGVRNATLLRLVREQLPDRLPVVLSDEYGMPAQYKEAIKFATLAFAAQNRIANNIPAASGASRFGVMGKLVTPPRQARLAE